MHISGYEIVCRDGGFRVADGETYRGVCFYSHSQMLILEPKGNVGFKQHT